LPRTYLQIMDNAVYPVLPIIRRSIYMVSRRQRVSFTITFPRSYPGMANSFLLVSAASLADFATPIILAGTKFPVLPTQAFLQITGLYDMRGGAALCFLLLVPTLAIFAGQRRWLERRGGSFVTVTGHA